MALRCYRCGDSLEALSLPLARLDLCPGCGVELHVCRMCGHYAPSKPDQCTEEDALKVRDKTAANFCDYFRPNPDAFDGTELAADRLARDKLADLFGDDAGAAPADDTTQEAATEPDQAAIDQANALFKR
jgi:hypothetical protein